MPDKEFEIFFKRLYLPLGMYALRLVEDVDIAEDLVQETFMNVWLYLQKGGKIDDFSSFTYRSLRNVCLSHLRRTKEMCNIDDVPEVEDEVIDTSIRDARIWRAIDELPKKCREIFLMSKRDGLSNSEIAEELDLSVKTVKNQITKAFRRLRNALPDDHKPFFLPFL